MKEIDGKAKNVRALLDRAKFTIDYYQREYRWKTKQVAELIEDLTEKFNESHRPGNERSEVAKYGRYFLGSIIVSDKDERKFIIDGQQRLTTLTLLLIHIYRHLDDADHQGQLASLVFSQKFGKRSFNLDVNERTDCMEALFKGAEFDESEQPESVVNIVHRYEDVVELFPDDVAANALPHFADWLIENVYLVEITAYSDADAYTIFETMNDRGLSLTPTEMLMGYLLANISEQELRDAASREWRKQIRGLRDIGKDEDADAIKAWLRSQYAQTIRERKRGARPRDFARIGTEFHRWVREHEELVDLSSSSEFARFIRQDFVFYGHWYSRLREAAKTLTPGLEAVHFCAQNNFTLQYPVLLAPLRCRDSGKEIQRKLRVVSTYLDILITRADLELACDQLLHDAVCHVPGHASDSGQGRVSFGTAPRRSARVGNRDVCHEPPISSPRYEWPSDPSAARPDDGLPGNTFWAPFALSRVHPTAWQEGIRGRAYMGQSPRPAHR